MLNKLLKNSRYDKITHRTPEYFKTMEIYQENIDKDDNKTWMNLISKELICHKEFLDNCTNIPNEPQNIQ